ncbi:hypothetical protein O0L34_g4793 [Tuta absoluta]|nr:hypothetical protein O0L34_g4793 [Tuta absoluta]
MDEKVKTPRTRLPRALELELMKAASGRPSWESRNEGIHERVNFDDTIWGFNLAGGSYYDAALRITEVKEDSRAEHAGILVGDVLTSINEIDTSTLTVQQAHDIILESGLEIKLAFQAPDVEETTHYVYQDELEDDQREANRLRNLNQKKERRPFNGAKTNSAWSLAWPCSKKRDILYKESNCYLVPSAYTAKHPDKIKDKLLAKVEPAPIAT